ncbi:5'-nucleotidase [Alkalihalobacillus alcalophilus ATCC 27647 = CGMCC 1.3604]|uniref:5'-nucleotidase n=1 Tax=Alkalihalobacillus alcalophilus ATCC 27647 = CGMCC 1.3604 TaxID=1218173 RepID=A0A094WHE3_ALKAL|nr:HAD family hydrolase [Alkalihalobacillus alcalophilus]KGA97199.1 5'-nucleotidase [Alkalihalobacillus alcalophilus ATCC 27647 = CGMCC 1.3604]MED1560869.1 HAD family hydrolase [Alkalihalobacillus alcalophilus]THG90873.1 5'-nucleotidase [Alkalihalobacillus alcalophilus ATCC 27647 = CGMCC 1.3604]
MNEVNVFLFDLDGTLTDPKVGITKSVQYALRKFDIEVTDLDELECFIGPPLKQSFSEVYSLSSEQTEQAIGFYRERFIEKGLFENELYPGVMELLQTLKERNYQVVLATSKPTVFAEKVLIYFKLDRYFDLVVGSHLDGGRSAKAEIIDFILQKYPMKKKSEFVMVGDRKHDLIGANEVGIQSIAVLYGYGSYQELQEQNPVAICESVEQLRNRLIK